MGRKQAVVNTRKAKILLFDIETMANLAWVWGKYDQNVIKFEQEWYMLTFAYKWFGDKKAKALTLPDFKLYKKDSKSDLELSKALWNLLDEADIVVGHNSDKFDLKKANARFIHHDLAPPTPYKSIDTLKIARRYFKFNSNKLDDLGENLEIGRKLPHTGFSLWYGAAVEGNKKDWKMMADYNAQDVDLLEDLYIKVRPWITTHPNLNLLEGTIHTCPNCASIELHRKGYYMTRVTKRARYQCQDCGAWSSAPDGKILR